MAPSSAFHFERKCLRNVCISIGFWHLTWIPLNSREMVILHVECNMIYLWNTKKRNNVSAFDFSCYSEKVLIQQCSCWRYTILGHETVSKTALSFFDIWYMFVCWLDWNESANFNQLWLQRCILTLHTSKKYWLQNYLLPLFKKVLWVTKINNYLYKILNFVSKIQLESIW